MLLKIANVLTEEDLEKVKTQLGLLNWIDGTKTAGRTARQVKRNQQADLTSRSGVKLRDTLSTAIKGHPLIRSAARPARFSKLLVSKTEQGGGYGMHIDNAFMGGDETLRTDLSFTLFLSSPDEYEGGELQIEHSGQSIRAKPDAGDLILYPSTSLHQVRSVTSGTRLVCVGWIESRIKRAEDREILFDVSNLKAELSKQYDPQSPELLITAKLLSNLLRRFS
ncbi:MAG: Fe2+-dependent dioxygenase [Pseudomonadota bacterium]